VKSSICSALLVAVSLILAAAAAGATIQAQRVHFDEQLDIEILTGYPVDVDDVTAQQTVGLLFRNHGAARRLALRLTGSIETQRSVALPAGETSRLFLYLPMVSPWYGAAIDFTDERSGKSVHTSVAMDSAVRSGEGNVVARLGEIDTAVNVKKPWIDLGILEPGVELPDDWRGLTGIGVLLVEQRRLRESPPWWETVADWIAMGGTLVVVRDGSADGDRIDSLPLTLATTAFKDGRRAGDGRIAVVKPSEVALIDVSFGYPPLRVAPARGPEIATRIVAEKLGIQSGARWQVLLLLAIFSVGCGPLAWSYLVKAKKRPFAYLASVFAGALLFSATLAGSSFWLDGLVPVALTRSVRFLDQRSAREIVLDEAFVFAPTSLYSELRTGPGGSFLLNMPAEMKLEAVAARLLSGATEDRLDGVLPVREPAHVGRRAIRGAAGRLVIDMGDVLRVENHLGGDLSRLIVWRDGVAYDFRDLRRGAAGTAEPMAQPREELRAFEPGSLLAKTTLLASRIRSGQLGARFFVGQFSDDPETILADLRTPNPGSHVIVGVYE